MLKFSHHNNKLAHLEKLINGKVYSFSLLSGHTCPFAEQCLSKVIRDASGKSHIEDGRHTVFRCFSASEEVLYSVVYDARKYNTDLIKSCGNVQSATELILESLPKDAAYVRIHVGGDFFMKYYFRAWCDVARLTPNVVFYAYTKSLRFWIEDKEYIPENMILTASRGGKDDSLISEHNLREAVVVYSKYAAKKLGLKIDHDDSHAALPALRNQSFALLLHGMQPKGSKAGKAVRKLNGVGSYGKRAKH